LGLLARRVLLLVFFLVRGVPFEPPNPRRNNVLSPKFAPPPRSGTVKEPDETRSHGTLFDTFLFSGPREEEGFLQSSSTTLRILLAF